MTNYRDQKITILGAGKSGIAAARLSLSIGAIPFVSDSAPVDKLGNGVNELNDLKIDFEIDGHSKRVFDADLWIISPGIPGDINIVKEAEKMSIPVISEVEFASGFITGRIAAITGTNGKSTTTELLGQLLKAHGVETNIVGNIGIPVSELVLNKEDVGSVFVIEMSSFQLERIEKLHPDVAILLNMSQDHLDRYPNLQEYFEAKVNIFKNMGKTDIAVLNADDDNVIEYSQALKIEKRYFSLRDKDSDSYTDNGNLIIGERKFPVSDIFLKGPHNLQNIMAALLALNGIYPDWDEALVAGVLRKFKGLSHRLEYVDTIEGVAFYNDSKATTLDSLEAALRSYNEPVILIAGGKNKGSDFRDLNKVVKEKVKEVVAIGKAGEDIEAAWSHLVPVHKSWNFEEAVNWAYDLGRKTGGIVLLSPACASFDMFDNFEDRGNQFKKIVRHLADGTKV